MDELKNGLRHKKNSSMIYGIYGQCIILHTQQTQQILEVATHNELQQSARRAQVLYLMFDSDVPVYYPYHLWKGW